jgi:hypothetical protein
MNWEDFHAKLEIGKEFIDAHHTQSKSYPFRTTSKATKRYNCIAWAAGIDDLWIQPDRYPTGEPDRTYYWPQGVSQKGDLNSYIELFEKIYGFEKCENGNLEQGYVKIALFYTRKLGIHATRQLSDGLWTSKVGAGVDASHWIETYAGGCFGIVEQYMRKVGSPSENKLPHQPYKRVPGHQK